MNRYDGMPELLGQFMQEQETSECWVTVNELRDRFGLTRYQCNTVSGFLRRLAFRTFCGFPYQVMRIEKAGPANPSDPPKARYLVRRKDLPAPPVRRSLQPGSPSAKNDNNTNSFTL